MSGLEHRSANVTEGARLDISANGFWGGCYEKTFVDVRVFNPHSDTAQSTSISACYTKHEKEKKRQYECRVREIEDSSFTPLVFSMTGGMSKQATIFYKCLASLLATKRDTSYNKAILSSIYFYLAIALCFIIVILICVAGITKKK